MNLIQTFIERSSQERLKITVVGDCMIDQHYSVCVNRISPEFPIPILKAEDEKPEHSLPGGAANVCRQLSRLNVDANLVSILDNKALHLFPDINVNNLCWSPGDAQVPIKKRYYHGDHPLCRIDIEKDNYGLDDIHKVQQLLFERYSKTSQTDLCSDLLILSDYNKGVFQGLYNRQRWTTLGVPTIVDPKAHPLEGWKGCTIFKPNAEEAARLSGKTNYLDQIKYFRKVLDCESVVITQGGSGVVGWDGRTRQFFEYFNTVRVAPLNVSGAGDCFSGFLAVAYLLGFTIAECAEIAFKAGAAYVQNMHNHPISLYDLLKSDDPIAAKYMNPVVEKDEKLVLVNGCFDILHIGHLKLLEFAKTKGHKLVVALNSDHSVKRLKGESRPINPLEERMRMVASLSCIDFVCSFEEDTPYKIIKKLRPNYLVKGSDYLGKEVVGSDLVEQVFLFDYLEGKSTTNIVQKLS